MAAYDLRAVNCIKGNSDPYAVVSIPRTNETQSTPVCLNTVNPKWYHNLIFSNVHLSDTLYIHLYDHNLMLNRVDLGTVLIDLGEALSTSTAIMSNIAYGLYPHLATNEAYAPLHASATHVVSPFLPGPYVPQQRIGVIAHAEPTQDQFTPSAPPLFPPAEGRESYYPHGKTDAYTAATRKETQRDRSDTYRRLGRGDISRASGTFNVGLNSADVRMQRILTREYNLLPQGTLHLVVVSGNLSDLATTAPRNHYKKFQINKFSEQVSDVGKRTIQRMGSGVVGLLQAGSNVVPQMHSVLELMRPVRAAFQEHSTWKIEMRQVTAVFKQKRQGWNRNYAAAQRIFEGGKSVVARRIVEMQHAYLYGGGSGVKPLIDMRKDLLEMSGNIIDSYDFLELMHYGKRRGKPRMFTYVLMEQKLYMAETGAEFFRDMMSKHAMHCSAATEVVYAGELHFRQAPPGSDEPAIRLIVDNNSGTYAPDKEDLPKVVEVFRRNFVGLHVTALDYQDPLLVQYRQDLPPSAWHGQKTS